MSAAIAQKNASTTAHYFDSGDLFNSNVSSETQHNFPHHMSESNLQHLSLFNNDNSTNNLEQKDNLELHNKDNGLQRFHNALTRTVSQPQPQQHTSIVAPMVTGLIENFGCMNLHRKLERTQSEPLPQLVNTSRYKTELCRPFEEAGECKYGEKCQFAHGYHELRNLQRHPKYKTEYCRTFHSVGFCPYGPRCHFVHNADEALALQQQMQMQQQQMQMQQQQMILPIPQMVQTKSSTTTTTTAAGANNLKKTSLQQQQQQQQTQGTTNAILKHSLPLSPPLSMSTGSDRESPTGSISLSPTSSMTSFPFGGDLVGSNSSVYPTAFNFVNTPPDSPNILMSPINTPPPTATTTTTATTITTGALIAVQSQPQIYIKPVVTIQAKQALQKSSSSPIATIGNSNDADAPTKANSTSSLNGEDARLPVFNRLSSAVDLFNLGL